MLFPPRLWTPPHAALYVAATPAGLAWDGAKKHADVTLSNGDLTAANSTSTDKAVLSTDGATTGKKYWACRVTVSAGSSSIGIGSESATLASYVGDNLHSVSLLSGGSILHNNGVIATHSAYSAGALVEVAIDLDNDLLWTRVGGGNWNNNGAADPATGANGTTVNLSGTTWYAAGSVSNNTGCTLSIEESGNNAPSGFSWF